MAEDPVPRDDAHTQDIADALSRMSGPAIETTGVWESLEARSQRRSIVRRSMGTVAALAIVVGIAVAIAGSGGSDTDRIIVGETTKLGTFDIPAPGDVAAEWLDDGTPVFVSNDRTLELSVVSAYDGHRPYGVSSDLVWWCESAGVFEGPRSGGIYDTLGRKIDGPAPNGLTPYAFEVAYGRLTVTRRLDPLPLDERGRPPTETGARCYGRTHETIPSGPVVRHDVVRDAQRFEPLAERPPDGQVVAVEGRIEIHRDGPGVLCANPTGVPCLKIADVVDAPYGSTLRSGRIDFPFVHGLMLVRMGPAGATDVASIDTTTPDDLPACGWRTYPSGIEFTNSETADPTCAEAIEEMRRGLPRAAQALSDERLFIEKAELANDRIVITVAGLAALGEPAHALIAEQVRTSFGDRFPVDVQPEGGSGSKPGAHTIADCDDVDRYGELIEDVGISFDYSASESPEDLANRADLVIAGTLASVRTEAEAGVDEALGLAVLEVGVDRILSGSAPGSPATVEVAFEFNAASREATEYENAPIGAAVVVFAHRVETGSAEYRASTPEGVWIACDTASEPSAGARSTLAGWQGISTIGDLTTVLLDLTPESPQPVTTR